MNKSSWMNATHFILRPPAPFAMASARRTQFVYIRTEMNKNACANLDLRNTCVFQSSNRQGNTRRHKQFLLLLLRSFVFIQLRFKIYVLRGW